ncbi:MAG: pentapeptide repeat-containing protein [Gammaproteobacteria bacterium]|nr:pentapeptide repeat-containing protein [Gammaproteobacteria bacterium]
MPIGHLWYVRRGHDKRGPFPAAIIERNIGLGRITATDDISPDGEQWVSASDYPDFALHAVSGREPARLRQLDERQRERRALALEPRGDEGRTGGDRREPEESELVRRRERANQVWDGLRPRQLSARGTFVAISVVLGLVFAIGWLARRAEPPTVVRCEAPAAPRVIWDFCSKQAVDLHGADLHASSLRNTALVGANLADSNLEGANFAYADLTAANLAGADATALKLTGASLRGTNLTDAKLSGADLEYADLSGANIAGVNWAKARLGNAIWTTGASCAPQSIGTCVLSVP